MGLVGACWSGYAWRTAKSAICADYICHVCCCCLKRCRNLWPGDNAIARSIMNVSNILMPKAGWWNNVACLTWPHFFQQSYTPHPPPPPFQSISGDLMIRNIQLNHGGKYICIVDTDVESLSTSAILVVKGKNAKGSPELVYMPAHEHPVASTVR